jgi:PAS domain-containing protein
MSDAVVVRVASRCIVDLNSKAQQLFDFDVEDVIGRAILLAIALSRGFMVESRRSRSRAFC